MGRHSLRKPKSSELLVSNKAKQLLEQINDLSQQLLLRLQTINKSTTAQTVAKIDTNKTEIESMTLIENESVELQKERDTLIHRLFEECPKEDISLEEDLLNLLVSLDSELSKCANKCKKNLTEHVIRLKNSKKVAKSYQKY